MSDIVERLRLLAAIDNCQASLEAADTITRLTAENEKLRAALKTDEAALQFYGPGHKYEAWCCWNAIMDARAALSGDKQ